MSYPIRISCKLLTNVFFAISSQLAPSTIIMLLFYFTNVIFYTLHHPGTLSYFELCKRSSFAILSIKSFSTGDSSSSCFLLYLSYSECAFSIGLRRGFLSCAIGNKDYFSIFVIIFLKHNTINVCKYGIIAKTKKEQPIKTASITSPAAIPNSFE